MKWFTAIILLGLIIVTLLPRIAHLDEFLTADEKRWYANVNGFTSQLAHGQFDQLLQQSHPGITTQWLAAPTVFSQNWAIRKLPLALNQSILVFLIGYIFWRLWGKWPGILTTFLLAINPALISHTRVYAMDSLLSLSLLLSLGLLLLWHKTNISRYLIFAAAAGAAAWLSKLPGILIIPFSLSLIIYWQKNQLSTLIKNFTIWLTTLVLLSIIILPQLGLNPSTTLSNFIDFFRSDDYQELHQYRNSYYLDTLLFHATPLHLFAILTLPFLLFKKLRSNITRQHLIILLFFAMLFVVMMSIGAKKGDRYILPTFLMLDVISAGTAIILITSIKLNQKLNNLPAYLVTGLILWQVFNVYQLHPYYLAYVNPITKPLFGDRKLGWGEGLDLAANYLNQKPNAKKLKVASFYPSEFSNNFVGETVPIHKFGDETLDYIVAYRGMYDRGPDAWETDVLNQLKKHTPEKIIKINGLEYAWIYNNN